MIAHDVIIRAATHPFDTSCMENANNLDLCRSVILMYGQDTSGKYYTIDSPLTTLATGYG